MAGKDHLTKDYPKIELSEDDWKMIEEACQIWCTGEEIASMLGISFDTLSFRIEETHGVKFSEYYKKHSDGGKRSLRRSQYHKAVHEGNTTMQIWLGKNVLGQKDTVELDTARPIVLKYNLEEKPDADSGSEKT